jgi:hypothetical protein
MYPPMSHPDRFSFLAFVSTEGLFHILENHLTSKPRHAEARAMVLIELAYRVGMQHEDTAELIWQVVFGDALRSPDQLTSPTQVQMQRRWREITQ